MTTAHHHLHSSFSVISLSWRTLKTFGNYQMSANLYEAPLKAVELQQVNRDEKQKIIYVYTN